MKATGKIGVFLFLQLFIFPGIVFFVQFLIDYYLLGLNEPFRRPTWLGMVIMLMGPYFFTYSKWANENIWNTKTSKTNNTSYTSSKEVAESNDKPIDNNHDILGNINLPSLSNPEEKNNDILEKIEELKRQIESLQGSLNTNDSSKLPEEKIDYGEYWKKRENFNPDDFKHKIEEGDNAIIVYLLIVLGLLTILGMVAYSI